MLAVSIPGFVLVQGVIVGLNYGLLALGLVLIYRTNRVLNLPRASSAWWPQCSWSSCTTTSA